MVLPVIKCSKIQNYWPLYAKNRTIFTWTEHFHEIQIFYSEQQQKTYLATCTIQLSLIQSQNSNDYSRSSISIRFVDVVARVHMFGKSQNTEWFARVRRESRANILERVSCQANSLEMSLAKQPIHFSSELNKKNYQQIVHHLIHRQHR